MSCSWRVLPYWVTMFMCRSLCVSWKYNMAESFCGVLSLVPALFTLPDVCLVFAWLCELHKCVIFQLGGIWLQFSSVCVILLCPYWPSKTEKCVRVGIIHDDKVCLDVVNFLCMSAEPHGAALWYSSHHSLLIANKHYRRTFNYSCKDQFKST